MGGFDEVLHNKLVIKIKPRHDSYTDQILRIVVVKVFMLASIVMGFDWFQGEMHCIPPINNRLPVEFIHKGCWVRGFYVYPRLGDYMRQTSYYGVPTELKYDGYLKSDPSILCQTNPVEYNTGSSGKRERGPCVAMTKEYYTQYHWMPFCISFLGFLFYLPYIVFRMANTDIISLKTNLKNQVTPEQIVHSYFNHNINSKHRNRFRIFVNYIVKVLYFVNSILAFAFLDWLSDFRFRNYGADWITWARDSDPNKMNFKLRTSPSPGNRFMPTFAMCDLDHVTLDSTTNYGNSVTVVCEISSHILYQYTFVIFWLILIYAMCSSFLGLIIFMGNHLYLVHTMRQSADAKIFYQHMTVRGFEYLDFIRGRDLAMYKKVLDMLNESVIDQSTIPLTFQPAEESKITARSKPLLRHMDSIMTEA